jgi:amidophosphoribosyltransferase
MEEICKYLGADSLGYLDVEGMVRATGRESNEFCMACFNGEYPVPFDSKFDKLIMEKRRSQARLLEAPTARLL